MSRKSKNALAESIIVLSIVIVYSVIGLFKALYAVFSTLFKEMYMLYKTHRENQKYLEQNALEQAEAERIEQELQRQYNNTLDTLRSLLQNTENKLYYRIEKTEFPDNGRIREYVNFYTYNKNTVSVDNANSLINTALNNVLGVYKGRSKKLQDTIVLDDYACDMKDISRALAEKLDVDEIRMVVA